MPEPLKNLYTTALINQLASCLQKQHPKFDSQAFISAIFNDQWANFELKQRMQHITLNLHQFLDVDYLQALPTLINCSRQFNGFETMFFPEYVELFGMHEFKPSMSAIEIMTQYSSSEFAIRPFIIQQQDQSMLQMLKWSSSKNHHVRRLASEGCRPRLPWAISLPVFKKDPSTIFPILENLKNDESEYVRRSVANNLNDISKDNPSLVFERAKSWKGQSKNTDNLIKHGCRTLLKQGQPEALSLFGFNNPEHITVNNFSCESSVNTGDYLDFQFNLNSSKSLGRCRIEYKIYFQKANASLSAKVFKISEADISQNHKQIKKRHSFKMITTRKYYPGLHQLEIIVNGQAMDKKDFYLI